MVHTSAPWSSMANASTTAGFCAAIPQRAGARAFHVLADQLGHPRVEITPCRALDGGMDCGGACASSSGPLGAVPIERLPAGLVVSSHVEYDPTLEMSTSGPDDDAAQL